MNSKKDNKKKVTIIGGGTAGWLTAAVIASHHKNSKENSGIEVSLIESSDIPTIGVGEGTWPTMKNTLQSIGIKEKDVFKQCFAGFKQGGKFVDWTYGNGDYYYHPFTFPLGYDRLDIAPYIDDITSFAYKSNFQQQICEQHLAPRTAAIAEYQGNCNYAYHFDAGAFGELLKNFCKQQLNVKQTIATVTSVESLADSSIKAITLSNGESVTADLFIDCSGFKSLLLGEHLGVPFVDVGDILFNDSALALQVPYTDSCHLASNTIATAQKAGWIWDIGLTHRRGVGYVYSSDYVSDDEACKTLQNYIGSKEAEKEEIKPKKIKFKSGYRKTFWKKNCVAVGLSAGFVEPLEATAIMLVELSARYIAENLPVNDRVMPVIAKRFNSQMTYRWSRIIDFLKLHYMLTKRPEPYWHRHTQAETIPQSLQEDLLIWQFRGPTKSDFDSSIELFPAASYQYVMYGMGFRPNFDTQQYLYNANSQSEILISRNRLLTKQYLNELPKHRQFIEEWLAV